jgi:hypothetical protein
MPLAERWNGTTWSIQPTPPPRGRKNSTLNGVSCTSRTFCIAVGVAGSGPNGKGLGLIERWNGTRWSIQHTPNPGGARESFLNSVSCTSATACTAVGSGPYGIVVNGAGYVQYNVFGGVRAERWNGSTWSIQRLSVGSAYNDLTGVSCTSRSFCIATGSTAGTYQVPLAERWNGTMWTRQRIPATSTRFNDELSGVACTFGTSCTAVGIATDYEDYPSTLAEHWRITATKKGHQHLVGKWSLQSTPSPPSTGLYGDLSFLGVSCISTTTCTAVGNQFFGRPEPPDQTTWAEQWNGLAWSITPTPAPPPDTLFTGLNGVSCTSSNACIAVGYITTASAGNITLPGQTLTLTERYS